MDGALVFSESSLTIAGATVSDQFLPFVQLVLTRGTRDLGQFFPGSDSCHGGHVRFDQPKSFDSEIPDSMDFLLLELRRSSFLPVASAFSWFTVWTSSKIDRVAFDRLRWVR